MIRNLIMHDRDSIATLKQGGVIPPQKLMELRSAGMQAVRLDFIMRLLRLNIQITTLSIYWEDGRDFAQSPTVENAQRKLVCATVPRVSGKFDDMALVSFAHDPEAKAIVDAELDRMVATIENFWLKSL
jgi:hypothetical protein